MSLMEELLKSKNWTHEEVAVLVECIESNQALLKSKHKDSGTYDEKNKAWDMITRKVNAIIANNRTK